jgi:hypothetical protein
MGSDDSQHGQREGDVRGRRDGPSTEYAAELACVVPARYQPGCEHVEQSWHDDAARGGDDGQGCLATISEVTGHELPLELYAGNEEEDG